MTTDEAAHAIHVRFMDYTRPFAGFLVCIGVRPDSIVVMCRREPRADEKAACVLLAGDVPVEFVLTGDFKMCSDPLSSMRPDLKVKKTPDVDD